MVMIPNGVLAYKLNQDILKSGHFCWSQGLHNTQVPLEVNNALIQVQAEHAGDANQVSFTLHQHL